MAITWRVLRCGMAATIVVALVDQWRFGRGIPTFRSINFFSYFTVLSNVIAAVVLAVVGLRPALLQLDSVQLARGAATLYMAITGIVYNVLLAPASADVSTNLEWVNVVVHVVGPAFVALDYLLFPPTVRPAVREAAIWLVFPSLWLIYTMLRGPAADWYPYPFLDPREHGTGEIVVTCVAIFAAFVLIASALRWWAGRGVRAGLSPTSRTASG